MKLHPPEGEPRSAGSERPRLRSGPSGLPGRVPRPAGVSGRPGRLRRLPERFQGRPLRAGAAAEPA